MRVFNIMAGLNQVPIDSGALSQHFTKRALHDGANQSPLIPLHSQSVITAHMESLKDAPLSRWKQISNLESEECQVEREWGPEMLHVCCLRTDRCQNA